MSMLDCYIWDWIVRYCVAKNMLLNMDLLRRTIAEIVDMVNHSSVCVWEIECNIRKIVEIFKLNLKAKTIIIFISSRITFQLSCYIAFSIANIFPNKFPA